MITAQEILALFNRISREWSPATAQALFQKFMKEIAE